MGDREHPPVDADGVRRTDQGAKGWTEDFSFFDQKVAGDSRGPDLNRPARDARGSRLYGPDGEALYEPRGSGEPYQSGSSSHGSSVEDQAAAGLAGLIVVVGIAVLAAFAWLMARLIGWWWPRVSAAAKRDIADRRLSWTTLIWLSPVILLVVVVASNALRGGGQSAALGNPINDPGAGVGTIGGTDPDGTFGPPLATEVQGLAAPSRVMSAAGRATIAGVDLSVVIPANSCGGYAFALRIANPNATRALVRYQFNSEVWGGESVRTDCYPNTLTAGTDEAASGKTVDIGFRDLGQEPTVMTIGVGTSETVAWDLPHDLVPKASSPVLRASDTTTSAGVELNIVKQATNHCGGYAFGLRVKNPTTAAISIRYSFQAEVWGGVDPSPECYPQTASEGSRSVMAGATTVIGFRDLGNAATLMTVAVGTADPVVWSLSH